MGSLLVAFRIPLDREGQNRNGGNICKGQFCIRLAARLDCLVCRVQSVRRWPSNQRHMRSVQIQPRGRRLRLLHGQRQRETYVSEAHRGCVLPFGGIAFRIPGMVGDFDNVSARQRENVRRCRSRRSGHAGERAVYDMVQRRKTDQHGAAGRYHHHQRRPEHHRLISQRSVFRGT